MIQPLWKMVWRFPKKLRIKPPYDPAIPPLGIYPEETKIEKDTCIPLFTAALSTIARTWKQPRCPSTDEWKVVVGLPWCPAVKNTPANARDVGLIPGLGRFHMLWGQLSLCASTT